MTADVAIVGNGVAGHACAVRLARGGARPLLVGPGLPTDRPPLSKQALVDAPRLLSDEARLAERGIAWLDGRVEQADLAARRLVVRTAAETVEVTAGAVVLAVGLSYDPPPVPGLERAHVNATPQGLEALRPELDGARRRVLVVGAGLVGTETAITLAAAGHDVTVVDVLERPLDRLHDPLPALAHTVLAEHGATFHGGLGIERAEIENGAARLYTSGGGVLEGELAIAATGGRPAPVPGLAQPVPIEVDRAMRVPGLDGVHAVGDIVAPPHARFGRLRFPQWDGAVGTAEQASAALLGSISDYERVPYWWSDLGSLRVAEVGVAAAAVEWAQLDDALHAGRDREGEVVCACVIGEPRRLRDAYALLGAGVRA